MITDITSPANPVFKSLKALADKKARREQQLFLAEGLRVCTEALATGHVPHTLIFAADAEDHPLTGALVTATLARRGTVLRATRDLLHRLTGKDNPGAVAAAYPIPDTGLAGIDRSAARLWVVAENLKDPGNLGTMLRTCDAVGAGGVILLDQSCDPFSLEAVRASMGGLFTRQVAQASGADFLAWLRSGPGSLVGAALSGSTVDYRSHPFTDPTFLFMGNEQSGLPAPYADACDALVKLPMKGTADSLNVAVATAVLLYAALAQFEPV
ncbi:TrmH family RNA methyltransferase [Polymorphobacter fuscus]|uniref:RNA methyltransferase n=1 Tax=Sandarakinorhabdus fusca TaxID=1439888 RepID=A0A7C9KZM5_9SPHN|nr:RNA methyltransferase [Polymorphobacter fuscus]KAB7644904.1 RNA methyltransferase [Polymorphobacter fuscus]MQT18188.1 RNA methyltransferase [Polymorphobacter fuscus]NJC09508.1 TrmH family RNA methyltransferase [Polymorphobacter fuscus]